MRKFLGLFLALSMATPASASFFIPDGAVTTSKLSQTFINGLTVVTPAGGDQIPISDTSDSEKKKKVLVSSIKNAVYRSVTTTDAVGADDETMKLSGASFTATLPTAVGNAGKRYKFLYAGSGFTQQYTLASTSAQTICGYASGVPKLSTPGEVWWVESDGANYVCLLHYTKTEWASDTSCKMVNFYTFTVTSASATIASTYTNNGVTFTTVKTLAAGTTLILQGLSAPAASGTLTKASGTGDATITFSAVTGAAEGVTATTTVPKFYGSPDVNFCKWQRDGQYIRLWVAYQSTVAGAAAGSGDYIWPMPTGVLIDTTQIALWTGGTAQADQVELPANVINHWFKSTGYYAQNGTQWGFMANSAPYTTSTYRMFPTYLGSNLFSLGSTHGNVNTVISYQWIIDWPVSGWQQ